MGSGINAEYMGTHPIFESDFDCLTEMRTTLARAGFNNANRVGFAGYGHKFHADEIVSADKRAFRDLKIYEVTGWIANQDVSPKGAFMGARRRFCAWRWKYASPIEVQTMVEGKTNSSGGCTGASRFAPTGAGIAQFYLFIFWAFYLFTYSEPFTIATRSTTGNQSESKE